MTDNSNSNLCRKRPLGHFTITITITVTVTTTVADTITVAESCDGDRV